MKQKEILLIIPYFGKLPNWFSLFLHSASKTDLVHFLLITDDKSEQNYPENFTVLYKTFNELKAKFHEKLGADIYLEIPYKLCDYKPTYGFVFSDLIMDYNFWGYCDIDIIFGDIDRYLRKINYSSYDRLFPHGHLTMYRNTPEINILFKTKNIDEIPSVFNFYFATHTTYPCHFDEIGMNFIVENSALKYYKTSFSRNTHFLSKNLTTAGPAGKYPEIIYYQDRSVIVSTLVEGKTVDEEIMYIHLMGKKDLKLLLPVQDDFLMYEKGFIPLAMHDKSDSFQRYGLPLSEQENEEHKKLLKLQAVKAQRQKIMREFKQFPLRAIFNILNRRKIAKLHQEIDFLKLKS